MTLVITGTGIVTSVGANACDSFAALCEGATGNKPLQAFDRSRYNLTRAYEIDDRPPGGVDVKLRATRWLCAAVNEAVKAARLAPDGARVVVIVGTGLRELRSLELWWADGQPLRLSELHFGPALRSCTGLGAQVMTLSNACAASLFALGLAEDLLTLGQADVVIAAGCDSITESMFGLSDRSNLLHPERVQPFDRDRRGVLLGEGAAAVVVESAERAAARGASPLAALRGVGMSCDAYHETAPAQAGMLRAMADAHARAGSSPGEVDLLMVHGTGTTLNDEVEARAVRELFGESIKGTLVTALKGALGHTSGGAGLMSAVTAIECMNRGRVPPTLGLLNLTPEAEGFDFVAGETRAADLRLAQVNAFGFGGVNAVAILERSAHEPR